MAEIENLDFLEEILKNQPKARKRTTPQFEYNISSFGL